MEPNKPFDVGNAKAKEWMKKHPVLVGIIFVFFLIFLINMFSGSDEPKAVTENPQPVSQISKDQAQKELTDFMDTAKKAKLISSYEFSDKASEVFIDSMWYTQKVDFKKDFIAKIGLLKKAVTGYTNFVAKDAYTNEKVAEITSFSQSIEVYK